MVGDTLFDRVLVPVASEDDAVATAAALEPYVAGRDVAVVTIHVIEKAGGALDKASVEQRELDAEKMFEALTTGLADTGADVESEIRYGTDVTSAIVDAAHEVDASAIVFTPRGGSRWLKLLTGDVAERLVEDSDLPVVVLPDREGDADGP